MNELKVFTLEEANRLIPRLTGMIRNLQESREKILAMEVEIDAVELVSEKKGEAGVEGPLVKKVEDYQRAVTQFYGLIEEIHGLGCFLKDVDLGLVDFYSMRQGRVVYLCWRLGEDEISFWHEVGRGYSHREPIN